LFHQKGIAGRKNQLIMPKAFCMGRLQENQTGGNEPIWEAGKEKVEVGFRRTFGLENTEHH